MELARAEGEPKFLKDIADVSLTDKEIASIKGDLIRNLRNSELVRTNLLALKPNWPGFSSKEIEALGNTNIFSLP